jgi:hypothetical protein
MERALKEQTRWYCGVLNGMWIPLMLAIIGLYRR